MKSNCARPGIVSRSFFCVATKTFTLNDYAANLNASAAVTKTTAFLLQPYATGIRMGGHTSDER